MMEFRRVCMCAVAGMSFAFVSITMYLLMCEKSKRERIQYACQQAENTRVEDKTMDFPFLTDPDCIDFIKHSRVMFIMRGLPGSGKSTIAHNLKQVYGEQAVICSADEFRYNEKGQYIWEEEKTEQVHLLCEKKAGQVCKQEEAAVVIIDNTNTLKRRLFPYVSIAHITGYLAVLVEPKTSWKHNIVELTRRNEHNVTEYVMRRMLSSFDPVNAVYYGWFLSRQDSQILRNKMQDILMECFARIPSFKHSLVDYQQEEQQVCPDPFGNFSHSNRIPLSALAETPHRLHVTTWFYKNGQTPTACEYALSRQVQDALGSVTMLSIIGWNFTPRTVTARVKLNTQQLELWRNMDADSSEGSTTPAVQNPHSPGTLPSSYTNVTIKPRIGRGDTAHITLSFRAGLAPVQGRLDLSEIIHHELTDQRFKEHTVLQGVVRNYDANLWVVYLNKPIEVKALFTGYYGS